MSKTSTQSKDRYNEKAYRQYNFRVRKKSELNAKIEAFVGLKGTSLNYLLTSLLCKHFDVPLPNPETDEW